MENVLKKRLAEKAAGEAIFKFCISRQPRVPLDMIIQLSSLERTRYKTCFLQNLPRGKSPLPLPLFSAAYDNQWSGGKGSHHPDYDPLALGEDVVKASRVTEGESRYLDIYGDKAGEFNSNILERVKFLIEIYFHCTAPHAELYLAIVEGDVRKVYKKIQQGADVNFVFGRAYQSSEGYTPLMAAAHRGRVEIARALLRAGANPNYTNHVHFPLVSVPECRATTEPTSKNVC